MCFGGGGSRATITKPDYNAYDKQFELQKEAIANSMDSDLRLKQQELQTALGDKADVQRQLNEQIRIQAENTNAQAMRLAQVIGPPPPEKTATAPVIGSKRKKLGKERLRIRRSTSPTASASGAGLNITTTRQ
jgi:small-conductance mechanosensitive channel|tara:strand:- start:425 stop:823 length:399 start_codon:yes stop_codon:yes gene_type:complete